MNKYVSVIIVVFMLSTFVCYGFGDDIGGSAKDMSLGFPSNTATTLTTNFSPVKQVEFTRSELYGSGVFYDHLAVDFTAKSNLKFGLIYEAISDQDLVDNSEYGLNQLTLHSAVKVNKRGQVGLTIRQESFKLQNKEIGKGFACDLGVGFGLMRINDANITVGFGVSNIATSRTYKKRVEIPPLDYQFSVAIYNNNLSYTIEHRDERLSMGVEYRAFKSLALRAGFIDGQPTLGCGLNKRNINIDCAYWLAKAGGVYRVSTGISW